MSTKVMLVDARSGRAASLKDAMHEAGYTVVSVVDAADDLYQRVLD